MVSEVGDGIFSKQKQNQNKINKKLLTVFKRPWTGQIRGQELTRIMMFNKEQLVINEMERTFDSFIQGMY